MNIINDVKWRKSNKMYYEVFPIKLKIVGTKVYLRNNGQVMQVQTKVRLSQTIKVMEKRIFVILKEHRQLLRCRQCFVCQPE